MVLKNGKQLHGEKEILLTKESLLNYRTIYLEPFPKAHNHALDEIMNADLVVFGPGGLYTSLIPNLLVEGVGKALRETKAKKVFIVNIMNKKVQTPHFKASNYLNEIRRFIGKDIFNYIIVNRKMPPKELLEAYSDEAEFVENDLERDPRIIAADLLENDKPEYQKSDVLANTRAFIRHDAHKLAAELMNIVNNL